MSSRMEIRHTGQQKYKPDPEVIQQAGNKSWKLGNGGNKRKKNWSVE